MVEATHQYSLKVVLEKYEGEKAILKTEAGGKIGWPRENLPENLKVGAWFRLAVRTDKMERADQKVQAKSLLNEILKGE